jgi:xylem cysteine proteinase
MFKYTSLLTFTLADQFSDYLARYGKSYATKEEYELRKQMFYQT